MLGDGRSRGGETLQHNSALPSGASRIAVEATWTRSPGAAMQDNRIATPSLPHIVPFVAMSRSRSCLLRAVKFTKCSLVGKIGCSFLPIKDDHYNEVARWLVEAFAHSRSRPPTAGRFWAPEVLCDDGFRQSSGQRRLCSSCSAPPMSRGRSAAARLRRSSRTTTNNQSWYSSDHVERQERLQQDRPGLGPQSRPRPAVPEDDAIALKEQGQARARALCGDRPAVRESGKLRRRRAAVSGGAEAASPTTCPRCWPTLD